jgi:hypothetical protein
VIANQAAATRVKFTTKYGSYLVYCSLIDVYINGDTLNVTLEAKTMITETGSGYSAISNRQADMAHFDDAPFILGTPSGPIALTGGAAKKMNTHSYSGMQMAVPNGSVEITLAPAPDKSAIAVESAEISNNNDRLEYDEELPAYELSASVWKLVASVEMDTKDPLAVTQIELEAIRVLCSAMAKDLKLESRDSWLYVYAVFYRLLVNGLCEDRDGNLWELVDEPSDEPELPQYYWVKQLARIAASCGLMRPARVALVDKKKYDLRVKSGRHVTRYSFAPTVLCPWYKSARPNGSIAELLTDDEGKFIGTHAEEGLPAYHSQKGGYIGWSITAPMTSMLTTHRDKNREDKPDFAKGQKTVPMISEIRAYTGSEIPKKGEALHATALGIVRSGYKKRSIMTINDDPLTGFETIEGSTIYDIRPFIEDAIRVMAANRNYTAGLWRTDNAKVVVMRSKDKKMRVLLDFVSSGSQISSTFKAPPLTEEIAPGVTQVTRIKGAWRSSSFARLGGTFTVALSGMGSET